MIQYALYFAYGCFGLALLFCLFRVVFAPGLADRVLALDTMYINGMLALLALGIRFDSTLYFDIALLIALFGFVGSAAMAKFLLRAEVIEP